MAMMRASLTIPSVKSLSILRPSHIALLIPSEPVDPGGEPSREGRRVAPARPPLRASLIRPVVPIAVLSCRGVGQTTGAQLH